MGFAWDYIDGRGSRAGRSHDFEQMEGAEEWLGDAWSGLLEEGVEEVELVDLDGRKTLYRMSLRPAAE